MQKGFRRPESGLQLKEEGRVESRLVGEEKRLFAATPAANRSQPDENT